MSTVLLPDRFSYSVTINSPVQPKLPVSGSNSAANSGTQKAPALSNRKPRTLIFTLLAVNAALLSPQLWAERPNQIAPVLVPLSETKLSAVPFVFSSETLGIAAGGAGVAQQLLQPQLSAVGIALYSSNDSWLGYLGVNHAQWHPQSRWLVSSELYRDQLTRARYYLPGAPGFDNQRAGSNDSDSDNSIRRSARSELFKLHFDYIFALGDGQQGAPASLYAQPNAGLGWNPAKNGVTQLSINPFFESQRIDNFDEPNYSPISRGVELALEWDNRDSRSRAQRGGRSLVEINYDWGDDNRPSWWTWELNQSLFVPLGSNRFAEDQTLALNAYLADTPSWNQRWRGDRFHRPPSFAGIRLGGFDRLRGHDTNRYHGRSALLYSAEYRLLPHWQPLNDWPVFKFYDIPWWHWTAFAELGRVSERFDLGELHQRMQWSAGIGARMQVEGVVVRAELAVADNSQQFWVMVNQPF